jgi:D-alanine-D-alanine ligase
VIKPAEAGSSLGVTIVKDSSQVHEALRTSFEYCDCALIERYVAGRELTVAILGEEALPVVELKAQGEFFDYRAKYQDPATGKQCPADLPREISDAVQATALAAHRALGCVDVSRTDIMLDAQGLAWVLEVNTLPGLTQASLYPKAAAAAGIDFVLMCEFLLRKAVERGRRTAAA